MTLNVSHPGRFGDLAWAACTMRQLAKTYGPVHLHLPVDPANTTPMSAIAPLLAEQEYIQQVHIHQDWSIELEAPRRPFHPPAANEDGGIDWKTTGDWVHLGYRDWPRLPLPFETASYAGIKAADLDLSPWITATPFAGVPRGCVMFHWTDRWFELKLGLTEILSRQLPVPAWTLRTAPNSERWPVYKHAIGTPFLKLARNIASVDLVVTDCSCVHVLAAAMGKQVVVVEPEKDRHHPIFWPGSVQDSETGHWRQAQNTLGGRIFPVLGGDHLPSFDARHTYDLIMERLKEA